MNPWLEEYTSTLSLAGTVTSLVSLTVSSLAWLDTTTGVTSNSISFSSSSSSSSNISLYTAAADTNACSSNSFILAWYSAICPWRLHISFSSLMFSSDNLSISSLFSTSTATTFLCL